MSHQYMSVSMCVWHAVVWHRACDHSGSEVGNVGDIALTSFATMQMHARIHCTGVQEICQCVCVPSSMRV